MTDTCTQVFQGQRKTLLKLCDKPLNPITNLLMETEFTTDFEGYKRMASELFSAIKRGATKAQIDNGLKALGLAFIYMRGTDLDRYQAEIVLTLAHRKADGF